MGRRRVVVTPLKLYVSVQTGRQYVLGWTGWNGSFAFFRLDAVDAVRPGGPAELPGDIDQRLAAFMCRVWGVSKRGDERLERLEMTICAGPEEEHIPRRLEREKRCGRVERLDESHWRFTAEVYDALELLPWVRTFIGRITALSCTDSRVTERFFRDLAAMAELYGGGDDAV